MMYGVVVGDDDGSGVSEASYSAMGVSVEA